MDRRNFMRSLIGGVAATAAVRAWPFRVFSFPAQPVIIQYGNGIDFKAPIGRAFTVKMPPRFILLGGRNLAYDGPVYG